MQLTRRLLENLVEIWLSSCLISLKRSFSSPCRSTHAACDQLTNRKLLQLLMSVQRKEGTGRKAQATHVMRVQLFPQESHTSRATPPSTKSLSSDSTMRLRASERDSHSGPSRSALQQPTSLTP